MLLGIISGKDLRYGSVFCSLLATYSQSDSRCAFSGRRSRSEIRPNGIRRKKVSNVGVGFGVAILVL